MISHPLPSRSCGECRHFDADELDPTRGACFWARRHLVPWWARDTPDVRASARTTCPVFEAREDATREPEAPEPTCDSGER